jgi:hypothetical protein
VGRGQTGTTGTAGGLRVGHHIPVPLNSGRGLGQAGIGTGSGWGNKLGLTLQHRPRVWEGVGAAGWGPGSCTCELSLLCDLRLAAHPLWAWFYHLVSFRVFTTHFLAHGWGVGLLPEITFRTEVQTSSIHKGNGGQSVWAFWGPSEELCPCVRPGWRGWFPLSEHLGS